jgi:hypothetical protein
MIIVAKPNPNQNPSYTSRELVNFNKKNNQNDIILSHCFIKIN